MTTTSTNPAPATEPRVVLVVVLLLGVIVMGGFAGTFWLIHEKAEGSLIAVFSGLTGTALGMVGSILNNTRTTPSTSEVSVTEKTPPDSTKNP